MNANEGLCNRAEGSGRMDNKAIHGGLEETGEFADAEEGWGGENKNIFCR